MNHETTTINSNHYVLLSSVMTMFNSITPSTAVTYLTICVLLMTIVKLYYDIKKSKKG